MCREYMYLYVYLYNLTYLYISIDHRTLQPPFLIFFRFKKKKIYFSETALMTTILSTKISV